MAAETIIESFCERCGTRYTFEPVRKRESKLVGLGKSLGILLDDQVPSSASRDPFHGTFHFCLECRQYTCPGCWNEEAGFCLGCMPLPDMPDTAAFDAAEAAATMEAASYMDHSLAEQAALDAPDAWPDADLHRRRMEALELGATALVVDDLTEADAASLADDDSWSLTFEPGMAGADIAAHPIEAEDHDDALLTSAAAAVLADAAEDVIADPVADPAAEAAALDTEADLIVEVEAVAETRSEAEVELTVEAGPETTAELEAVSIVDTELDADAVAEADLEAGSEPEEAHVAEGSAEVVAELETDAVAEVDLEAGSEPGAAHMAEASAGLDAVADAVAVTEGEAAFEPDARAEPASDAVAQAEPVAEITAEADAVAAADPEPTPEPLAATRLVAAAVVAAHDDDHEADWADLLGRLPDEDELVPDDWAAMAPALGPDIAPVPLPAAPPAVQPSPVQPPPVQPPPAQPPARAATPWQLTAPAADAEARSTAWPPLGPVYRPTPAPAPEPATPHPSVMAQRAAPQGLLARGQQGGAAQLPKGVRPCVSCELPLSASARFCRRCGRPQG